MREESLDSEILLTNLETSAWVQFLSILSSAYIERSEGSFMLSHNSVEMLHMNKLLSTSFTATQGTHVPACTGPGSSRCSG